MGDRRATQAKTTEANHQRKASAVTRSPLSINSPVHPILQLQQKLGNQAVNRLIQTKMQVGEPNDVYEKEADSVAAQVMRMSAPSVQHQTEEEEIQTKPIALQLQSDEEEIQTLANPDRTPQVSPNLATKIQSRRGTGQLLPKSTRAFMEPRFGADFSTVRVHTDSSAVQMNQELGAQAFTHGRDIFYGAGKSPGKNRLTAHELTHTIQQTGGIQAKVIAPAPTQSPLNPPLSKSEASANSPQNWGVRGAKPNKVENKAGFALQIEDSPGNGVNQESPTLVKDTEIKPEVEGENTVDTEVVAPQETAQTKAETAPKPETKATSVSSGETPQKHQEVMAPEAAHQGIKAEVDRQTTATAAETTPQAPTPASPESDPDFQAVVAKAKGVANQHKQHAPASTKAKQAQAAAVSPAQEIASKAQAHQVGEMAQAPTPSFNAAAFKAKLMERIQSAAPTTLEDADEFKNSNKLNTVKSEMQNQVKQEQTASQSPLEQKAKQAPDTSSIEPKSVTPLPANEAGAATQNIGAHKAIPKAKGQGEVEAPLQESRQKLDRQMAEADVTTEQLAKSNEPQFQTALAAKQEAQTNANQAPQAYRQFEQNQLTQAQGEAATTAERQLQGMQGSRAQLFDRVTHQQIQAKGKDEQERTKVASHINGIYQNTKTSVENILNGIQGEVISRFNAGTDRAKKAYENYVSPYMEDYKSRYDGIWGVGRWLKDKLLGVPPEVTAFFREGRNKYLHEMDVTLTGIANYVTEQLNLAKEKIAEGRRETQKYVEGLPASLQQVGKEAASNIQSQFDRLEQSVNDKHGQLIDTLSQVYTKNLEEMDARIEEMKASNQPWFTKAANAITGVIDTINKLKDMLLSVLSKAASAIGNIIKDPISFLGYLISGIKQGFENFVANIGQHLQAGLIGWLTGTLGPMGIQIPDDIFSLPGIFNLVTQVLGLTFTYIRGRAVKLFGEPVVAGMEKSVEIFQVLRDRGAMGLWEQVKEQFSDLKQTVIEEIKNMVVTQAITAGVKWILSLLNPASAFVKAAMAIYDIIMFFINRGSQVLELVNAVVDAVSAIASGAVGGAAKLVENALAKAVPVVIGFLASLLGVGGLAKKVEKIIGKIRDRIDRAIEKVLLKARGLFKGKKGKYTEERDPNHERMVKAGLSDIDQEEKRYVKEGRIFKEDAKKVALKVTNKHNIFKSITVVDNGERWDYLYIASPPNIKKGEKKAQFDTSPITAEAELELVHDVTKEKTKQLSPAEQEELESVVSLKNLDPDIVQVLIKFWKKQINLNPRKEKIYEKYITNINEGLRPSPAQSEAEMAFLRGSYAGMGSSLTEIPYKHGRTAKRNEKGHTRPDIQDPFDTIIEVKRYLIKNKSSLVNILKKQINDRRKHLPYEYSKRQAVIVDLRGQEDKNGDIPKKDISDLRESISEKTDLPPSNIEIIIW